MENNLSICDNCSTCEAAKNLMAYYRFLALCFSLILTPKNLACFCIFLNIKFIFGVWRFGTRNLTNFLTKYKHNCHSSPIQRCIYVNGPHKIRKDNVSVFLIHKVISLFQFYTNYLKLSHFSSHQYFLCKIRNQSR